MLNIILCVNGHDTQLGIRFVTDIFERFVFWW